MTDNTTEPTALTLAYVRFCHASKMVEAALEEQDAARNECDRLEKEEGGQ